jgi:hypothetical protein
VLLNYSGKGLEALLSGRAALALSATVKISFLINGLLSLPMYLFPYQASAGWNSWKRAEPCCWHVCVGVCALARQCPPLLLLGLCPSCSCRRCCQLLANSCNWLGPCLCPARLQRNLWSALPNQSADDRMSNQRSFALTNIVSLAGELAPAALPYQACLPALPAAILLACHACLPV